MRKFLMLTLAFLLIMGGLFAQQSKVWDYPIRPGSEEWSKLQTLDERLNVYNIPDDLLSTMTTKHLVETCLNYPELRMIMTRNSLQQGYGFLKSVFNGFRELEKRKDSGKELIKEYIKLNPAEIKKFDTTVKRGGFAFSIKYIEILLAQKPILANLNNNSKKELIKQCISNYETIEKMPEEYATFGLMTPALVLGRLLDVNNYQDFVVKTLVNNNLHSFVNHTFLIDSNTLTSILIFSKAYLKQLKNE